MKMVFRWVALAAVVFGASVSFAGITEWCSVVQTTDNFKVNTYAVMTNEDYTKLVKTLWDRNLVLTRAIQLARSEWTKSDDTKDKVFPVTVTCKAEAKRLKTFPDTDQAAAYVSMLEAKDAAKAETKGTTTYLEKRIAILTDELENPPDFYPTSEEEWVRMRKEELAILLQKKSERDAVERLKEEMAEKAKTLIESYIVTLVNAPTAQTSPIML